LSSPDRASAAVVGGYATPLGRRWTWIRC